MKKTKFSQYNLSEEILKALELMGFENSTEVQHDVIPTVLEKHDVIVKSQTGSGKTAAFGIPVCQLIDWDENKAQALVITPTRELALQVREDIFNIGRFKRIKVAAVYGKAPFWRQEKELKQKTHIVSGTPGRIIDHIEKGTLDLSMVKYLVIDEADEMLNMGFIEQLHKIISSLPKDRTTMLFSATMPNDIESLCQKYMNNPKKFEIEVDNSSKVKIIQELYNVEHKDKVQLLKRLTTVVNPDSCIVFCNTKQKVDEVDDELYELGYTCDRIHGGMEQKDRIEVMNNFKAGNFRYLIATDVAARGIDVDNISLVVNFDIPQDAETYVHRIGRTGRNGKEGHAVTFVASRESRYLKDIEAYIESKIEVKSEPSREDLNNAKIEFDEKMKTRPKMAESKSEKLNKDILKIHINAGKKTKMRAVDIVGTLCSIEGMSADDIGIINVMDISTFVEILNGKGEMVFAALQNKNIKGRTRRVSRAND
ncbi:MAG: DEAD/DEAH box helicase [Acidaminobacteraceae bacterium]